MSGSTESSVVSRLPWLDTPEDPAAAARRVAARWRTWLVALGFFALAAYGFVTPGWFGFVSFSLFGLGTVAYGVHDMRRTRYRARR